MGLRRRKGTQILMGNAKRTVWISGAALAVLLGCTGRTDPDFIGSAIVEAQTYQVSAMTQGKLVGLYKQEGQDVTAGELLAVVDTIPYYLQMQESKGSLTELVAGMRSRENDLKAAQADIRGLEKDYARIAPLVKEGSVPPQQEDKLTSSLDAARAKYASGKDMLESLGGKRQGLEARMAQIREQLDHCYLRAPASGRVLTRYKNPEETAAPGQPVFEIGQDDTLRVDFFVPQTWLSGLKYGQAVRIRLDTENGKDGVFLPATISWIGNQAEFSPKNIQTRESRNELVF